MMQKSMCRRVCIISISGSFRLENAPCFMYTGTRAGEEELRSGIIKMTDG